MLRAPDRVVVGIEGSRGYVEQARRDQTWLPIQQGDVTRLPFRNEVFDAAVMLDVLEHVDSAPRAVAELRRVLKPGGLLVLSVPHAGVMQHWDSLNVYSGWADRFGWRPIDETERGFPEHRHFSVDDLAVLLQGFRIDAVIRTGLGVSEPVNTACMTLFRGLVPAEPLYKAARLAYFTTALIEDPIPFGGAAYNITLRAVRL
jgi:SAM-dependent methyltransferase